MKTRGVYRERHPPAPVWLLLCFGAMALPMWAVGQSCCWSGHPARDAPHRRNSSDEIWGLPVIASDDLIAHNPQKFQKYRTPALNGVDPRLDPALNGWSKNR